MTAPTISRLVGVDELRRAWLAVQAGDFRPRQSTRQRASRRDSPVSGSVWTPAPGERVVPLVGSAGWCGATTVALAIATSFEGPARVVECASVSATGLAAASTAELGSVDRVWTRGARDHVLLDRAAAPHGHSRDIPPSAVEVPLLTVVDVAQPIDQVLEVDSWLARLVIQSPRLVVVGRVSVPGLRRLESCLGLFDVGRTVLALLGPPLRRWPRKVIHSTGVLTAALLAEGRFVEVPDDRMLAVRGLTPAPLPAPLIAAGTALLHLMEGLDDVS